MNSATDCRASVPHEMAQLRISSVCGLKMAVTQSLCTHRRDKLITITLIAVMEHRLVLVLLVGVVVTAVLWQACEARGGRGRGGGSFGGIFGGWRKYKKPTSTGNSRRTMNGSPTQTVAAKPLSHSSNSDGSSMKSSATHTKTQPSYPKQQMTGGASMGTAGNIAPGAYHSYYGAKGGVHLPPGGSYYTNAAGMPPGAVYYAHPPMRSSSGTGDFLIGMMAGHMVSNALHGHRSGHYPSNQPNDVNGGSTVIIINNGQNETAPSDAVGGGQQLWPMDTDVPLAPFKATTTQVDDIRNVSTATSATVEQPDLAQPLPTPPIGGIICVPVLFNETDPNDPTKVQHVEKVLCYPAPPPPVATPPAAATAWSSNCTADVTMDTKKDRNVAPRREDCLTTVDSSSTASPPPIVGEIIDAGEAR